MPSAAERQQMAQINATIRNMEMQAKNVRRYLQEIEAKIQRCEADGDPGSAAAWRGTARAEERNLANIDRTIGQYQRDYNALARRPDA